MRFAPPSEGGWKFAFQPSLNLLLATSWPPYACLIGFGIWLYFIRVQDWLIAESVAFSVVLAVVLFRSLRVGVWADRNRVVVQNTWRTYEFVWADVVRIRAQPVTQYTPGRWYFELRDERVILAECGPVFHLGQVTEELASVPRPPVEFTVEGKKPRELPS